MSPRLLAICVILLQIWTHQAFAEETEKEEKTKEVENPEAILIMGQRPMTASSDQTLRDEDFKTFPHKTASDLMRLVPGLHITQHTGGAKAHQIFLRGFDAEHGQDLAVRLDGVPINEISQVHGQGYLDLHFLIPEVISRIQLIKGPYDARWGNFATAGAVEFSSDPTAPIGQRAALSTSLGMFQNMAGLAQLWLGRDSSRAHLALQAERSNGFTDPGELSAARLWARVQRRQGPWRLDAFYAGYRARSQAADTLPAAWIENGLVGRFASLDDSNRVDVDRHLMGLRLGRAWAGGRLELLAHWQFKDTRIFSNYSFFYFNPIQGDQLEQSDARYTSGLGLRYRRADSFVARDLALSTEIGVDWRYDAIWQSQANTVDRVRINLKNHYRIHEQLFGLFAHEQLLFGENFTLVGGLRLDLDWVQAEGVQDVSELDIHTNRVVTRDQSPVSASEPALAISPKLSAIYAASTDLTLFANFGRGFVSRPARDQANDAEFWMPAATGLELGTRWQAWDKRLSLVGGLWWMHKDQELIFDPEFGATVQRGQSHRAGAELEFRIQPIEGLILATDLFAIWTQLKQEDGWGPIPNAPAWLMTNLVAYRSNFGLSGTLRGRLIGPRDHDLDLSSKASYLLDLMLSYRLGSIELSLMIENLLNTDWYDSVFAYPVRPAPEAEIIEGLQVTAGTPFAARITLTWYL